MCLFIIHLKTQPQSFSPPLIFNFLVGNSREPRKEKWQYVIYVEMMCMSYFSENICFVYIISPDNYDWLHYYFVGVFLRFFLSCLTSWVITKQLWLIQFQACPSPLLPPPPPSQVFVVHLSSCQSWRWELSQKTSARG